MTDADDRAAIERVAAQRSELCDGGSICIYAPDRDTLVRLAREALELRARLRPRTATLPPSEWDEEAVRGKP